MYNFSQLVKLMTHPALNRFLSNQMLYKIWCKIQYKQQPKRQAVKQGSSSKCPVIRWYGKENCTHHMISLRTLSGLVKILEIKISPDKPQSVFTDVDETAEGLDWLVRRGSIVRELKSQSQHNKHFGVRVKLLIINVWEAFVLFYKLTYLIHTYDLLQNGKIIWKQIHITMKVMYKLLCQCMWVCFLWKNAMHRHAHVPERHRACVRVWVNTGWACCLPFPPPGSSDWMWLSVLLAVSRCLNPQHHWPVCLQTGPEANAHSVNKRPTAYRNTCMHL